MHSRLTELSPGKSSTPGPPVAGDSFVGNVYHVSEPTVLREFETRLDLPSPRQLTHAVYASASPTGPFQEVWSFVRPLSGWGDRPYRPAGPSVTLVPGQYYLIGVGFDAEGGPRTFSHAGGGVETPFGHVEGGVHTSHPAGTVVSGFLGSTVFEQRLWTDPAVKYEWWRDDGDGIEYLVSSGSPTLVVDPVSLADDGARFTCRARDAKAISFSDTVTLSVVDTGPAILVQPAGQAVKLCDALVLDVTAFTGLGVHTYQWRKDGVPLADGARISGSQTPSLSIVPVQAGDGGTYDVVVTDACGSTASDPAPVQVLESVTFTEVPADVLACEGELVEFHAQATSAEAVFYQWYRDGEALAFEVADTLALVAVDAGDAGEYHVVAWDGCQFLASPPATLNVAVGCVPDKPVVYVDATAPGAGDGSSWADAFPDLRIALASAGAGTQVWVAQGTYTPDGGTGDRTLSFELPPAVSIYGGFAGGEIALSERDPQLYPTVLSGDLLGDDLPGFGNRGDNAHHVVTATEHALEAFTDLDGFTVRGGHPDSSALFPYGGGFFLGSDQRVRITGCVIEDNLAASHSAGLYANGAGSLLLEIEACTFRANQAPHHAAFSASAKNLTLVDSLIADHPVGGAIDWNAPGRISGSVFQNNHGSAHPGALKLAGGPLVVDRCVFQNNTSLNSAGAVRDGSGAHFVNGLFEENEGFLGAIFSQPGAGATATYTNCTFLKNVNTAGQRGGAIAHWNASSTVSNCTFVGNSAGQGGAIFVQKGDVLVANSILWGNTAQEGAQLFVEGSGDPASLAVRYSDVQGGPGGVHLQGPQATLDWQAGNLDTDPLLQATGLPTASSPTTDAADNLAVGADLADLDGDGSTAEPVPFDAALGERFVDQPGVPDLGLGFPTVDMGAYELDEVCQPDLGFGGPGSLVLAICGGGLGPGQSSTLQLTGAPAGAPAFVLVSTPGFPDLPYGGGLLVSGTGLLPGFPFANQADAAGELSLPLAGKGAPLTLVVQVLVLDLGQPQFLAISNAVLAGFGT